MIKHLRLVLLFGGLLTGLVANAGVTLTGVHELLAPEAGESDYQVLSTADGRIYSVSATDSALLDTLTKARFAAEQVRLVVDEDRIIAAERVPGSSVLGSAIVADDPAADGLLSDVERQFNLNGGYQMTNLTSLGSAKSLYTSLEKLRGGSQCYQRAHLWSYQMYTRANVQSAKVFLFFTRLYIKAYKYKWWFHVAPFVLVNNVEFVLDPTFTEDVLSMRDWTDMFMKNKAECPVVKTYQQYEENQQSQWCYLRKVPMFYYQPINVEQADEGRGEVTFFRQQELKHAERARPWF